MNKIYKKPNIEAVEIHNSALMQVAGGASVQEMTKGTDINVGDTDEPSQKSAPQRLW